MAITARQIEAFRATLLTGSTKSASEMLCVTQPVISRLLSQLEHSIGFPLFVRKGNSLIPNEKAIILLDSAKKIYSEVENFQKIAENIALQDFQKIKIFVSPTFATSVLPKIISCSNKYFAGAQFEIYSRLIDKIPGEVISNQNAIGISIWPTEDSTVHCELLAQRPISVLVSPHNPLVNKLQITQQDLIGEKIISYQHSLPLGRMIAKELESLSHCLQVAYLIDNGDVAYSLVRENLGVALIDSFSRSHLENQGLKVIPFKTQIKTNICLISSRFYPYGSELELMRLSIQEWLNNDI